MVKKGNAVVLTLVLAVAIGIAVVLIQLQYSGSPTSELTPGQVESETKLILENAITKGIISFMDYGYSRYDPAGSDKGSSAWFCNDGYAPPIAEADKMLKNHIKQEVNLALDAFRAENAPDLDVTWTGDIQIPDTKDGTAAITDLPDDTLTLIIKGITVKFTDENGDTQTQTIDVPFNKNWKIWSIYKTLYKWTDEDIGDLKQEIYDLIEASGECKNRLCTCGSINLDEFVEEVSVKRSDVEQKIEDAFVPLKADAEAKGLSCEYVIVHLNVKNNEEYKGHQLGSGTAPTEIVDWPDWWDGGECAVGSFASECSQSESNKYDDIGLGSLGYGDVPALRAIYHAETVPDSLRCESLAEGNCGCPVSETETSANVVSRPKLLAAPVLGPMASMSAGPSFDDRGPLTGPRVDLLGVHKHVSMLLSVTCKSTDEYFETPTGDKPLASNALFMVSMFKECNPPDKVDNNPIDICADGDCVLGGTAVAAGAEWLDVLNDPCAVDSDCGGDPICYVCADCTQFDPALGLPPKCCALRGTVKTALDSDPKFCKICYKGKIGACIQEAVGGTFPCGSEKGATGSTQCGQCECDADETPYCASNSYADGMECSANGCKVCDSSGTLASCVAQAGGDCNSGCGTCDASGGCTTPVPGATCDIDNVCADYMCDGAKCVKDPSTYEPADSHTQTSTGACGEVITKACDGQGNFKVRSTTGGCGDGQTCCAGTCCASANCCLIGGEKKCDSACTAEGKSD